MIFLFIAFIAFLRFSTSFISSPQRLALYSVVDI